MLSLFQKSTNIQSFYISSTSSGHNKPVAYGPGSEINGTLMLTLDKPLMAKSIRIIFKCEIFNAMKKESDTLFSVESTVWGDANNQVLSSGSHMYLFAIKLPQKNYPPSTTVQSIIGYRINYSIQGVIDFDHSPVHTSNILPILYLPLIICNTNQQEISKVTRDIYHQIQITAELIKPAYCPGDLCTIKLITNNSSKLKLTSINVFFNLIVHQQKYTLLSEQFYISKQDTIIKFELPSTIVPTFKNDYIDIQYEILFTTPIKQSTSLSLPILITTIPHSYPIQAIQDTVDELPSFVPHVESPLPSPMMERSYSVSPSNSFQLVVDGDIEEMILNSDNTGHLMVPEVSSTRRTSNSSITIS